MKHRIRKRFKYARKMLKWLFKRTYGYIGTLLLIGVIMLVGQKSMAEPKPETCRSQITEALEAKNSSWLSLCGVFVSYHGFNDQGTDQFRVYRKLDK